MEVEGPADRVQAFVEAIPRERPPLAAIDRIEQREVPALGERAFRIRSSRGDPSRFTRISPDVATCEECRRELFDPRDRRYRYPFINCTNCGPRFTILRDIPYDRPNTTMAAFPMCSECEREYHDPLDRRFHAQPNACPRCGPHVWFEKSGDSVPLAEREEAIALARRWLVEGCILAIKGLGGFHLACDARNGEAVARLRRRKRRSEKPFAVMVADLNWARHFCHVSEGEARALLDYRRPIVLLDRRQGVSEPIAEEVAPGNRTLGLFLPYTPLHELLFDPSQPDFLPALVMTSGNLSEEPIAIGNEEARRRLGPLADGLLLHNREICTRCDDSVIRVEPDGAPTPIRRSRGYAPDPIRFHRRLPSVLAVGAELKNTICLTREEYAFPSQHIGDLKNAEAYGFFRHTIDYFRRLFRIDPGWVAYDLHPDYLSTRYALEESGLPGIGIQHHHAHIVALLAEYGLEEPIFGVSLDGTGYGLDGAIWGGEFLIADPVEFRRWGHLRYFPLIGGDQAVLEPLRVAYALAERAFPDGVPEALIRRIGEERAALFKRMIVRGVNCPPTSSMGRLFDGISALIGVCERVSYEAQAAIELEHLAEDVDALEAYPFSWDQESPAQLDPCSIVRAVWEDLQRGTPRARIAGRFHETIAQAICQACLRAREETGIRTVGLSGGVFQNRRLLRRTHALLEAEGFRVLRHHKVPPNDGGIALGQAYSAALQVERKTAET
ncbi:MAG: carbamoyltransferase HypF [Candidatus Poribacteria bacterium]|nr:MAG: carbamoyltransferase HypF [Candidatus Poribacteria bacterium]